MIDDLRLRPQPVDLHRAEHVGGTRTSAASDAVCVVEARRETMLLALLERAVGRARLDLVGADAVAERVEHVAGHDAP